MFTDYPTYSPYRTLRLVNPHMQGEDVYALQSALFAIGVLGEDWDGVLGPQTARAIKSSQAKLKIAADGLGGGRTQIALARYVSEQYRQRYSLPVGLPFGQCMHESSCRLGNYSPRHGDDYDAGVAQRNTAFTPPEEGFNVSKSVAALATNLRNYYDKFRGLEHQTRRWELAAGAWNAPAYACWIAKQEGADSVHRSDTAKPGENARLVFELYMKSATAYLEL